MLQVDYAMPKITAESAQRRPVGVNRAASEGEGESLCTLVVDDDK